MFKNIPVESLHAISPNDLQGTRALLRLDLNIPTHNGIIIDDTRLKIGIKSIKYLLHSGAQVIVLSHLGRPEGKWDKQYSLKIIQDALYHLGVHCHFETTDIREISSLPNSPLILLENIRFYKEELENDKEFAKHLAQFADFYVNDAFSASHRLHASISAITHYLPSYRGLEFTAEVEALNKFLGSKFKRKAAIIGGSKISTKLPVLLALAEQVDYIIPAGGIANTFLLALGHEVGNSLAEPEAVVEAKAFLARAKKAQVILPKDVVLATTQIKELSKVNADDVILDLGPKTVEEIIIRLQEVNAVLWNGPLGYYEDIRFRAATHNVARAIIALTQAQKLTSIIGGGDLGAALKDLELPLGFTYISTSGGAFLEYIAKLYKVL